MKIYIIGVCTKAFNKIDADHINASRKRIFVDISDSEISRLRIVWGKSYMPLYDRRRIIVNIYGKKDMTEILDRPQKFLIKISKPSPQYSKKRFIFKSCEPHL